MKAKQSNSYCRLIYETGTLMPYTLHVTRACMKPGVPITNGVAEKSAGKVGVSKLGIW